MAITITNEEARVLANFIRSSLHREWDQYTDHYIVSSRDVSWEDGMKRMNPEAYDLANSLEQRLLESSE